MARAKAPEPSPASPLAPAIPSRKSKPDDSRLQSVTVPRGHSAQVIKQHHGGRRDCGGQKSGQSERSESSGSYRNLYQHPRTLINIEFDKLWKDANDTVLGTDEPAEYEIYIQLQRVGKQSDGCQDWRSVTYPTSGSKICYGSPYGEITTGSIPLATWISTRLAAVRIKPHRLYLPHCGRYGGKGQI